MPNGRFKAKLKLDLLSIDVFIDFSLIDIDLCSGELIDT